MNEILVLGDIEKSLTRLKQNFKRDLAKDVVRHSYYLSSGQRKRLKRLKAIKRLKKLELRSLGRVTAAQRRFLHDERTARLDYERNKTFQTQQVGKKFY
jgi:ribosomal protein S21